VAVDAANGTVDDTQTAMVPPGPSSSDGNRTERAEAPFPRLFNKSTEIRK
jgi:hypothetical protein